MEGVGPVPKWAMTGGERFLVSHPFRDDGRWPTHSDKAADPKGTPMGHRIPYLRSSSGWLDR